VPGEVGDIHGQPGDGGRDQPADEAAQGAEAQERTEDAARDGRGQAAEQRDDGKRVEQQHGDGRHQEEMFDHVGGEERVGKAVERRGGGEPEEGEAGEEGAEAECQ
jgi:hypothetical protein